MAVIFWGSSPQDLRATPVALLVLDHLALLPGLDAVSGFVGTLLSSPGAELLLRKTAHIAEFALLAYLLTRALPTPHPRPTGYEGQCHPVPPAGVLSLAYAVADELHQHFVPGRSCRLEDVLIDAVRICLGLILARMADRKPSTSLRHEGCGCSPARLFCRVCVPQLRRDYRNRFPAQPSQESTAAFRPALLRGEKPAHAYTILE